MANKTLTREQVYKLIDSEREYQENKWGKNLSGNRPTTPEREGERTVDEFVLYIAGYNNKLVNFAAEFAETSKKLDFVRKIAGLCVACMEQHGGQPR